MMVDTYTGVNQGQDRLLHALSSRENFVQYLDAESEIQALTASAKVSPSPPGHLAYNRWSITWLKIKTVSLHCFCKIFNCFEPYLGKYFPNFTKKVQVRIKHKMLQYQVPHFQILFNSYLLESSLNAHRPENSEFYLHPNVTLRARIFENGQCTSSGLSKKEFLMSKGICAGMCDWLTYLYFNTLPHFSDPEIHLRTLAKLFENGAPRQAELLQLFGWTDRDVLDLILRFENVKTDCNPLTLKTLNEERAKSCQFLKDLPIGVYRIQLSMDADANHALRYFNISDNLKFLFDPNIGLIKLTGNGQFEDFAEKLLTIAHLFKDADEWSHFEFHQVRHDEKTPSAKTCTINVEMN